MRCLRFVGVVFALLAPLAGCAEWETPPAREQAAITDWNVREASLGGSYDLAIEARHGAQTDNRHVALLRFEVSAGQRFAAVMRRSDDSALDAYLTVYREDGSEVATSDYDQALLPMAQESDAIVIHSAATDEAFTVFAADLELAADARFQIDLVALDSDIAVDATMTSVVTRALVSALRYDEPAVAGWLTRGALSERGDGLLDADLNMLDELRERAQLSRVVAKVNDVRGQLFAVLSDSQNDSGDAAAVGTLCAELWTALRSEQHALR